MSRGEKEMNHKDWKVIFEDMTPGLVLLEMGTGTGKTYTALKESIDLVSSGRANKVIFVTTQIKNLPYAELKTLYSTIGKENQFEQEVVILKSILDSVLENINLVKGDTAKSSQFEGLKNNVDSIKKVSKKDPLYKVLLNEFSEKLEPAFRNYIKRVLLPNISGNSEKIREEIRSNKDLQWIGKMYPAIFLEEKKIIFMTVDKLLFSADPLVGPKIKFLDAEFLLNSIVILDEFDATKNQILGQVINKAVKMKDNYLDLFSLIKRNFDFVKYNGVFRRLFEEKNKDDHEKLVEEANEIYELGRFDYFYKTQITNRNERNLLFYDGRFISKFLDNESRITSHFDKNNNQMMIDFIDQNVFNKEKTNSHVEETDILSLIIRIYRFLRKYHFFVEKNAKDLMEIFNSGKNDLQDLISIDSAKASVLSALGLKIDEYQTFFKFDFTQGQLKWRENSEWPKMNRFYHEGFQFFEIIDSISHLGESRIRYVGVSELPEKILLFIAKNAKVVGMSATASIPTVLDNYDLNFIQQNLKGNFLNITDQLTLETKEINLKKRERYQKYGISVLVNSFKELLEQRSIPGMLDFLLSDVSDHEEALRWRKKVEICFKKISNEKKESSFNQMRYLEIFYVMKKFILDDSLSSLLALNMRYPREELTKYDLKLLANTIKTYSVLFNKKEAVLKVLDSSNFDKDKQAILNRLAAGEKVLVISSYTALAAGQNIQYSIPEKSDIVCYMQDKHDSYDLRYTQKDFDALYLGEITQLLPDIYADKKLSDETFLKYVMGVEYLFSNYEITADEAKRMISKAMSKYIGKTDFSMGTSIKSTRSARYKATKMVIQAIGRLNRTFNKNKHIEIFISPNLLDLIDLSEISNISMSPELQKLKELKAGSTMYSYKTTDKKQMIAQMRTGNAYELSNRLRKSLTRNQNLQQDWKYIRQTLLKHPTVSDLTILDTRTREFIETYYIPVKGITRYYCAFDPEKTQWDFYLKEYLHGSGFENKKGRTVEVSASDAELSKVLNYSGMKTYFNQKNYATDFEAENYILNPILFRYFYKGALGEVCGKFILEKELQIKLEDVKDASYFEFFDFQIGENIFIDFKHWRLDPGNGREELEKISKKLDAVGGRKALIINLLSRSTDYMKSETKDERIVRIPALIDENGGIISENLAKIKKVIIE